MPFDDEGQYKPRGWGTCIVKGGHTTTEPTATVSHAHHGPRAMKSTTTCSPGPVLCDSIRARSTTHPPTTQRLQSVVVFSKVAV
jgi:hypothetical protein